MVFGGKFKIRRCNSKASYLPRQQSRDKLNTDPDHGSYKLTLTSSEDNIHHHHHHHNTSTNYSHYHHQQHQQHQQQQQQQHRQYHHHHHHHQHNQDLTITTTATTTTSSTNDLLQTNCNNLPDILPVNAKLQQQNNNLSSLSSSSSSPSSAGSSPRYGPPVTTITSNSNNNNNNNNNNNSNCNNRNNINNINTQLLPTPTQMVTSSSNATFYPLKSVFHFHSSTSSSSSSNNRQNILNMTSSSSSLLSSQLSSNNHGNFSLSQQNINGNSNTNTNFSNNNINQRGTIKTIPTSTSITPTLITTTVTTTIVPSSMNDNVNNSNHNNNNNNRSNNSSNENDPISPKFMSQSTIDLKKTHIIKANEKYIEKNLSPTQSDMQNPLSLQSSSSSSLSAISNNNELHKNEIQKTEIVRKLSSEDRDKNSDGHIVRAEIVNTTLSTSPSLMSSSLSSKLSSNDYPNSNHEKIIRKDSLRNNIEKITQLQSKLMSAHIVENGGERRILGYSGKTVEVTAKQTKQIMEKELSVSMAKKELKFSPNLDRKPQIPQQQTPTSPQQQQQHHHQLLKFENFETINRSPLSSLSPVSSPILTSIPISTSSSTSTSTSTSTSSAAALLSNETDKISQMDTELDGLKLMQRTEIILRLNAPTSEAASQTDEILENELSRLKLNEISNDDISNNKLINDKINSIILEPRKKLPEEIDCNNLSNDIVNKLPSNDKLCEILSPKVYKISSDYINNLYNPCISSKLSLKRDVGTSTPPKNDKSIGCELNIKSSTLSPLLSSSSSTISVENFNNTEFYNTNELSNSIVCTSTSASTTSSTELNKNNKDIFTNNDDCKISKKIENENENENDCCDLVKKKKELVIRLTKKIQVLENEQTIIGDEISINDQLGKDIANKVTEKLRPIDATKFRAYIDDIGHITMLLLSLSGRLAKVENSLCSTVIDENQAEKKILETKRDRLMEQLNEAKNLKEDIDRRGAIVSKILDKYLTNDEYNKYEFYINMKAKLIVDLKEISDKIKISEEQLSALKFNLTQSES